MLYNIEELKTYCGLMELDLRGNWAFGYVDRIEDLNDMLREIINHKDATEEDKSNALQDIQIGLNEIEDGCFDGRVYRDSGSFYGYFTQDGYTEKIYKLLCDFVSYPENLPKFELDNELSI